MSKTRSMYAGSSGYNYGANTHSEGNGNGKWQGLWPSVGLSLIHISEPTRPY